MKIDEKWLENISVFCGVPSHQCRAVIGAYLAAKSPAKDDVERVALALANEDSIIAGYENMDYWRRFAKTAIAAISQSPHKDYTWEDIAMLVQESRMLKSIPKGLLNPQMPAQELRLHMGELTASELRTARAAIRWANSVMRPGVNDLYSVGLMDAKRQEEAKEQGVKVPCTVPDIVDASTRKDETHEAKKPYLETTSPTTLADTPRTENATGAQKTGAALDLDGLIVELEGLPCSKITYSLKEHEGNLEHSIVAVRLNDVISLTRKYAAAPGREASLERESGKQE